MPPATLPRIIQGGMGVAVSGWRLANAVSRTGHLGVVSGTVLDTVLVRRLQDGDPGGHVRRALAHFPIPGVADEIVARYFREGGRPAGTPYKVLPMYKQVVSAARQRVTVAANFVEVWLAREGHANPVGINLLTKVQMPNLASLYGAMLGGVSYVLMGAGIPRDIPGILDTLAGHGVARMRMDVEGLAKGEEEWLELDPATIWGGTPQGTLERPKFIGIISAASLATTLARKATGQVDGFVVEGATAGGHNAPPRGGLQLDERGEPIYGERDLVDLSKMRELGLPFWLAGGMGSPGALAAALAAGAAGIQCGTPFAFCAESGVAPDVRRAVLEAVSAGGATVFTDPYASPTGFPFKVVRTGDPARDTLPPRTRVCDLGYLRVAARRDDGRMVYRCAAEPVDAYVAKGGNAADTVGRQCLCNGLTATVGYAQVRDDIVEPPLVTSGNDLSAIVHLMDPERRGYTAGDVIRYLTS